MGGLLVAAVVLLFFPLPPVTFHGRLRPWGLLVFGGRFVVELVRASAHIARIAVQPGYTPVRQSSRCGCACPPTSTWPSPPRCSPWCPAR
ncbi:hypothetical protein GCM10029963_29090 [Micromonospora andamanensis]